MCLIGAPAFDRGPGVYSGSRSSTNEENVSDIAVYKLRTLHSYHLLLVLHHSYIVYVLFVSDTDLDCNMVHVPHVRYHNTVTSGNPGKNRPAFTNCR